MNLLQTLTRVYSTDIEKDLPFYKTLLNEKCERVIDYTEMHLKIARVGSVLLICGTGESLKPFKNTLATFLVDSVEDYKKYLLENKAVILRDIKKVPTGFNMTVKHSDGIIIEYVEFSD
jgi:predicted enzyme related to lactoylglutathione lyase